MSRYDTYLYVLRYSILAGAVAGSLLALPVGRYSLFMLMALALVSNTQLRLILNKKTFLILSVMLDAGFVFFLSSYYSAIVVVILLITLTDLMLILKKETYPLLLCIVTPAYAWCAFSEGNIERGFILEFLYLAFFLLLAHVRKELSLKINVESLYDQLRITNYDLEATRSRLVEYSKQVEANTKLEERNRISRELHDSVGHRLTGILMQVDAAIQVMEVDGGKGMTILKSAYGNINESIEAVRDTVRKLNPSGHTVGKSPIRELINRFIEATGITVEYETCGVPYDLLPSVETILYRNMQEAFTNSLRHGQASHINVQMIFKTDELEVIISDNGRGCAGIVKGFGLSGMEERLDIVGGSIYYIGDNGFTIDMKMPVGNSTLLNQEWR